MLNLIDLASGKNATQSSKHPNITEEIRHNAANAINPATPSACFHTATEWFPWWQVDLEEKSKVSYIKLYNTEFWPVRARLFTILISLDGEKWEEIFSKTTPNIFGETEETAFSVKFSTPIICRYIRIRLDNYDQFHLKTVRIYGTPCLDHDNPAPVSLLSPSGIIVFATNYNEDDHFLPVYISNFLHYTPDNCHLFINFPPSRHIPHELLEPNPRIHIFNGHIKREKWGGTLLLGHMESYAEALHTLSHFEYFCTTATNSLFIRPFDFTQVVRRLDIKDTAPVGMTRPEYPEADAHNLPLNPHCTDNWSFAKQSEFIEKYLIPINIEKIYFSQIESLFAEKSEWDTLYYKLELIHEISSHFKNNTTSILALEEFLPVTFFHAFGKGRSADICHILWLPPREITSYDLLSLVPKLPSHICQEKWFDRHYYTIPTAAVSLPWSRAFLASLSDDVTPQAQPARFLNRALVHEFATALRN